MDFRQDDFQKAKKRVSLRGYANERRQLCDELSFLFRAKTRAVITENENDKIHFQNLINKGMTRMLEITRNRIPKGH